MTEFPTAERERESITGFLLGFTGFYWFLLGFTGFSWVLASVT